MARSVPVLFLLGFLLINTILLVTTVSSIGKITNHNQQLILGEDSDPLENNNRLVLHEKKQPCSQGTKIDISGKNSSITAQVTRNERASETPIITITIQNNKTTNTTVTGTVTVEVLDGRAKPVLTPSDTFETSPAQSPDRIQIKFEDMQTEEFTASVRVQSNIGNGDAVFSLCVKLPANSSPNQADSTTTTNGPNGDGEVWLSLFIAGTGLGLGLLFGRNRYIPENDGGDSIDPLALSISFLGFIGATFALGEGLISGIVLYISFLSIGIIAVYLKAKVFHERTEYQGSD